MNLVRQISPATTPIHIAIKGELAVNRERILQTLLLAFAFATFIGYLGAAVNLLIQQQFERFFWLTLVSLVFFSFVAYRKLPYSLRAWVFVLTFLATSLVTFYQDGPSGNGKLFLLTFNVLTAILVGWKTGIVTLLISQIGLGGLIYVIILRPLPFPFDFAGTDSGDPNQWFTAWISLGILASVVTFSLALLIRGLESAYLRVNRLTADLTSERNGLKNHLEQNTHELQRRIGQILTAGEISRMITAHQDPFELMPQIAELIRDRFRLYFASIFLVDETGDAVLKAATGEAGRKMLSVHHTLPVGGASLVGWSIANRQARIAVDVGLEAVRFNNPLLPDTRSEMAVPILRDNVCLGALSLQSDRPFAFDTQDIQILQSVADSLAIALENTQLVRRNREAQDEVRALNREYLQTVWGDYAGEHGNAGYTFENGELDSEMTDQVKIPLALRDQVLGQITLETDQEGLTPAQLEWVDAITTQTALALENARLLEETRRRAAYEQTLNQLTSEFSRAYSIDEILKSALQQLSRLPTVKEVAVHLVPPEITENGSPGSNGNGSHPVANQEAEA